MDLFLKEKTDLYKIVQKKHSIIISSFMQNGLSFFLNSLKLDKRFTYTFSIIVNHILDIPETIESDILLIQDDYDFLSEKEKIKISKLQKKKNITIIYGVHKRIKLLDIQAIQLPILTNSEMRSLLNEKMVHDSNSLEYQYKFIEQISKESLPILAVLKKTFESQVLNKNNPFTTKEELKKAIGSINYTYFKKVVPCFYSRGLVFLYLFFPVGGIWFFLKKMKQQKSFHILDSLIKLRDQDLSTFVDSMDEKIKKRITRIFFLKLQRSKYIKIEQIVDIFDDLKKYIEIDYLVSYLIENILSNFDFILQRHKLVNILLGFYPKCSLENKENIYILISYMEVLFAHPGLFSYSVPNLVSKEKLKLLDAIKEIEKKKDYYSTDINLIYGFCDTDNLFQQQLSYLFIHHACLYCYDNQNFIAMSEYIDVLETINENIKSSSFRQNTLYIKLKYISETGSSKSLINYINLNIDSFEFNNSTLISKTALVLKYFAFLSCNNLKEAKFLLDFFEKSPPEDVNKSINLNYIFCKSFYHLICQEYQEILPLFRTVDFVKREEDLSRYCDQLLLMHKVLICSSHITQSDELFILLKKIEPTQLIQSSKRYITGIKLAQIENLIGHKKIKEAIEFLIILIFEYDKLNSKKLLKQALFLYESLKDSSSKTIKELNLVSLKDYDTKTDSTYIYFNKLYAKMLLNTISKVVIKKESSMLEYCKINKVIFYEEQTFILSKKRILQKIFESLAFEPNKFFTAKDLFITIWKKKFDPETDIFTVRTAINRLRDLIKDKNHQIISHQPQKGYYIGEDIKVNILE
ncbi:MAG: hypothetical protein COB02_07825 [Candidatus Cloacimonadota bacterium]|nr:MAG: hypothetical protein COB02_07825 [Candidatus Cloacimonadota bacterium]